MKDQDKGILAKMKEIMETMPELAQLDPQTLYDILKKEIIRVAGPLLAVLFICEYPNLPF